MRIMAERDSLEVDVLFVGAGPASLAGAIRLTQLAKAAGKELEVLVIDKAGEIGNHGLSGAVMDPKALDELLPEWRSEAPVESPVTGDQLWLLTENGRIKAPLVPPMMNNHGKYVASLQKIVKWLAQKAETAGAQVFGEFPGQELLWEGERVVGVRTGDKGLDKHGNQKSNYEPVADIFAKVDVLGEG